MSEKIKQMLGSARSKVDSAECSFHRAHHDATMYSGHFGISMSAGMYSPSRGHCASAGYDIKVAQQMISAIIRELKDADNKVKKLANDILTELYHAYHDVDNPIANTASVRLGTIKKKIGDLLNLVQSETKK